MLQGVWEEFSVSSDFEIVATTESSWQAARDLDQHTLLDEAADRVVAGHLHFLKKIIGWRPGPDALDLGAGSGHTTQAFRKYGVDMTASEHTDAGIDLLKELNPGMPVQKISMADYHRLGKHSLIFARELYPITRVNAFAEQRAMVDRLVDSLSPGGVLLIVGSDVYRPHCMDYHGMVREFKSDERLSRVYGPYLEPIIIRSLLSMNMVVLSITHLLLYPFTLWKRRSGWAAAYVVAFVRR